ERQRRRARDHLELVDLDLDLARGQVRVHGLRRAGRDLAGRAEHELVPDVVRDPGGFRAALRVDHQLGDARLVAKVDEDQAPVIAAARGPARQGEPLTDAVLAELPRPPVAPAHGRTSLTRALTSGSWPGSTTTTTRAPSRWACVRWPLTERPAESMSALVSPRRRSGRARASAPA